MFGGVGRGCNLNYLASLFQDCCAPNPVDSETFSTIADVQLKKGCVVIFVSFIYRTAKKLCSHIFVLCLQNCRVPAVCRGFRTGHSKDLG